MKKIHQKFTSFTSCLKDARKYKSKMAWKNGNISAYRAANKNGWMDKCSVHMTTLRKKRTFEEVHKSALNYDEQKDWRKHCSADYHYARRHGWIKACTKHMQPLKKDKYTKEECLQIASKYDSINSWRVGHNGSYGAAHRRSNWVNECSNHMKPSASLKERCVYIIGSARDIYVGLTWNYEERIRQHIKSDGPIKDMINKYGFDNITFIRLIDYINCGSAQKFEEQIITYFKKKGLNVLNKIKGGGLGANFRKWSFNKVMLEAQKYNRRVDFKKSSPNAYNCAHKQGWLELVCSHMPKPHCWTEDECIENAKMFKTRNVWRKKQSGAYKAAKNLGCFEKCVKHMSGNESWTVEKCFEDSKRFFTRSEWIKSSNGAYEAAVRFGVYKKCVKHMLIVR
jgi:predicted GIY-YIG superfamily endonuclease